MTDNPYAPPIDIVPAAMSLPPTQDCYHYGNMLVVRDGTVLPHVCPKTNQETGSDDWRKQLRITWTPQWVIALILVNILVVIIVALCIRKSGKITYSMSKAARKKVRIARISGSILLALSLALVTSGIIFTAEDYAGPLIIFGIILIFVALYAFGKHGMLRAHKFKNGWFLVKGCDPSFLARFPDAVSAGLSF